MSSPTVSRYVDGIQEAIYGNGYNPALATPGLNLRYGTVVGYNATTQLVDITLSDGGLILEDCDHLSNYIPTIGDHVYVLVFGPQLIVLDRLSSDGEGPSLFSNATWGIAPTTGLFLNADFAAAGDYANVQFDIPPGFTLAGKNEYNAALGQDYFNPVTNIGVSGQLILAVSCYMQIYTDAEGSTMSGTGWCSPWITPVSGAYDVPPEIAFSVAFTGTTGQGAMVSNLTIVEGFDPGPHYIKLIQAAMGAYIAFGLQTIVAIPT